MKALIVAVALVAACSYEHPAQLYADAGICAMNNGGCSANATCAENGNPRCMCKLGFAGDGISCNPVWSLVTSVPAISLSQGATQSTAVLGSKIYWAPDYDTAGLYFKSYDLGAGALADEPLAPMFANPETDFCNCGATQVFVPNGDSIYMFGNYGAGYNTITRTWSDLTSPYQGTNIRGEAFGVAALNRVYLLGGRDPNLRSNEYFDGTNFTVETTVLPFDADRNGGGASAAIGNTVYVFGGGSGYKNCAKRDVSTSAGWQVLADAPLALGWSAAVNGDNILVTTRTNTICVYSISGGTWRCNLPLPSALQDPVVLAAGTRAYLLGDTTAPAVELYRLEQLP